MKFYIFYANTQRAKECSLPRACSSVELKTIEDVINLRDRLGYCLVFDKEPHYDQYYLEFLKEDDDEDSEYLVDSLPDDIDITPTITVYNGYLD